MYNCCYLTIKSKAIGIVFFLKHHVNPFKCHFTVVIDGHYNVAQLTKLLKTHIYTTLQWHMLLC